MELCAILQEFIQCREASRIYRQRLRREDSKKTPPESPLLYLANHNSHTVDHDLKKADIPKTTPAGTLDFHALRTTFGTLLDMLGASEGENQAVMRHAPKSITYKRYVMADDEAKRELVEGLWNIVNSGKEQAKRQIIAKRKAAGAENFTLQALTAKQPGVRIPLPPPVTTKAHGTQNVLKPPWKF